MRKTLVRQLRQRDIGLRVIADPQTGGEETLRVAGVLRWITFTSDDVILAIEDGNNGAVEWAFGADDTVEIGLLP